MQANLNTHSHSPYHEAYTSAAARPVHTSPLIAENIELGEN